MRARINFFATVVVFVSTITLSLGSATASTISVKGETEGSVSLRITRQPGGARSGSKLTKQPIVRIYDANNRLVRSGIQTVTVTSSSGELQGSRRIIAIDGTAKFTDLALFGTQVQAITLTFTLATGESVRSAPFTFLPAKEATSLKIDTPSNIVSGQKLAIPLSVYAIDAAGNKFKNMRTTITLNVTSGSLYGETRRVLSSSKKSVASFPFLTIVGTGTITITATASNGLTGSVTVESQPGCPEIRICKVGDIGPGGGVVYFAKSTPFTSAGSPCSTACRYLEVAPINWEGLNNCSRSSPPKISKCSLLPTKISAPSTSTAIGSGYANTELIISALAGSEASNAAVRARAYRGGDLSDWYLPSRDELMTLSDYSSQLNGQERQTSLFVSNCRTWSSSIDLIGSRTRGWAVTGLRTTSKSSQRSTTELNCVQPVRAF